MVNFDVDHFKQKWFRKYEFTRRPKFRSHSQFSIWDTFWELRHLHLHHSESMYFRRNQFLRTSNCSKHRRPKLTITVDLLQSTVNRWYLWTRIFHPKSLLIAKSRDPWTSKFQSYRGPLIMQMKHRLYDLFKRNQIRKIWKVVIAGSHKVNNGYPSHCLIKSQPSD